ncbi:MAG: ABC transporter permease [Candidatus Aminicenantes bacterium]|nr:ABC transporter permease [Candidatus Aminicenantes bacterium]MBL7082510.1 ABC transporter permease [Candidatus Aminicenantes bacterium]
MNYELFIAKRYLTAKRKQAFISVITFISILGITIGVMALIIAIALITGFQGDVQEKLLGSTSHILVSDIEREGLKDYPQLIKKIENIEGVKSVSPVALDRVLIRGPSQSLGGMLKGVDFDLEKEESTWLQELQRGQIPVPGSKREGILLGRDAAISIGAGVGDIVEVLSSSSRLSPIGPIPKRKRFVVTGIFYTGLYEFDSSTALIWLETAQKFLGLEEGISYIQIKINDIFQAPKISEKIIKVIPPQAYIMTWMELNKSLFAALKLEKNIMFLTIALIVLVAALNIIATLILMVMEKTRDIGILIAMGATAQNIKKIFFLQGAIIGIIGTASGVILGMIWCWLANAFELIKVPVDIYQISFVPFHIKPFDLILIVGITLLISFLSTLFPSHRASKINPVMALKYE